MATKRCPTCSLINPGSAQRCDCGYSFADGSMGPPLRPKPSEDDVETRRRLRIIAPMLISIGVGLLAVMARVVIRDGYHASDAAAFLVLGGFGVVLIGVGIAMRVTKR